MKITRKQLMKVIEDPKVICWSYIYKPLNVLPLMAAYNQKHEHMYSISQILMGDTLIKDIEKILKERIKHSKDKRVRCSNEKHRMSLFSMDALNSCPTTAKTDINYMEFKDL